MFENQMKKKSAARNGNHLRGERLVVDVAAGDVVAGQVVGDLDRHLHLVRLLAASAARSRSSPRSSGRWRAPGRGPPWLMREVDAADVDVDPGSSLNSFWGWNSSFLPALPKITTSSTRISEVERRARSRTFALQVLIGRSLRPAGSRAAGSRQEQLRDRQAARWTVTRASVRIAAARPASRSPSRPTSRIASATSQTRPSVAGRRCPSARRRSPRAQRGGRGRGRRARGSRAGRARRRRRPRSRPAASRRATKTGSASASSTRSA